MAKSDKSVQFTEELINHHAPPLDFIRSLRTLMGFCVVRRGKTRQVSGVENRLAEANTRANASYIYLFCFRKANIVE